MQTRRVLALGRNWASWNRSGLELFSSSRSSTSVEGKVRHLWPRFGQSKTQINAHLVRVLSGSFGTDRCLPCTVSHLPSSARRLSLGPTAVCLCSSAKMCNTCASGERTCGNWRFPHESRFKAIVHHLMAFFVKHGALCK